MSILTMLRIALILFAINAFVWAGKYPHTFPPNTPPTSSPSTGPPTSSPTRPPTTPPTSPPTTPPTGPPTSPPTSSPHDIAITPIVMTTITEETVLICMSSTNSAINIAAMIQSISMPINYSCNGVILYPGNETLIANQPNPTKLVPITITQVNSVQTHVNGDRIEISSGVVSGGPCNGSQVNYKAVYKADQANGCTSINGATTSTAYYAILTLSGSCITTCQIYLLGDIGFGTYTLSPGVNNNGLVGS